MNHPCQPLLFHDRCSVRHFVFMDGVGTCFAHDGLAREGLLEVAPVVGGDVAEAGTLMQHRG